MYSKTDTCTDPLILTSLISFLVSLVTIYTNLIRRNPHHQTHMAGGGVQ
jgi:hypothetical protein